ncbi:MAG: 50S ribosomal protein L29 [Candidatus Spechtbacteria bacterium]|nr:50S ribosomal protein L29 [Candidatus Spechtbacteria bacterium]
MDIRETRQKSIPELESLLRENQAHYLDLRFRVQGGRVKNVNEMQRARKDIARLFTLLRQATLKK